jgi:hypothetical protein
MCQSYEAKGNKADKPLFVYPAFDCIKRALPAQGLAFRFPTCNEFLRCVKIKLISKTKIGRIAAYGSWSS